MSGDKPVHPAAVHFPIAFISLANGIDVLTYLRTAAPSLPYLTRYVPFTAISTLHASSYNILSLGLLTTIPAVLTGGQQLLAMISRGGWYEADGATLRPKVKLALVHAAANDLVFFAGVANWWFRGQHDGQVAEPWNVALGVASSLVMIWSAGLGGSLTYNHGVGMSMGKKKST